MPNIPVSFVGAYEKKCAGSTPAGPAMLFHIFALMKATVMAKSLSDAMKNCMHSSSPRLAFRDDGSIFVDCNGMEPVRVNGYVEKCGYGYVEFERAKNVVQVLDMLGDSPVTITYDRGGVILHKIIL